MDRAVLSGLALGAVVAMAGGAVVGYRMLDRGPQYAEVLAVSPVSARVRTPRQLCTSEQVRRRRPVRDPHDDAAIERRGPSDDTYTRTEQHCATVYETRDVPHGYEVRYRLNGVEGRVRMEHRPGRRILVRDGRLVLDEGT
jgi:uncharacterized protein YcfJ